MTDPTRLGSLFAAIDARDVEAFAAWLTDDCRFVYGSREPVRGLPSVRDAVAAFFAAFAAIEHRLDAVWEVDGASITEGSVTYTGHDGSRATLPFCNVLRTAPDGRIRDYRVYVDPSPLG
jgi:ketosteroid isomerase-like protein